MSDTATTKYIPIVRARRKELYECVVCGRKGIGYPGKKTCGSTCRSRLHRDKSKRKSVCPSCGGNCSPECGRHPAGCIFGGLTEETSYWLIADGCELHHGE